MTAFEQAEQYINEIPRFAGKNTVEDTSRLLTIAGCDRLPFPVIHVAGTNGKGSVCACLASILKESRDLYVSPSCGYQGADPYR